MSDVWISRGWPVVLLSAVVFAGDYALTVWGARLYRNSGAKDILQYEGSYELTPYYQADIESGRWFSRRFVLALLGLWPMLFAVGVGSVLVREVPVCLRHVQNISFFRHVGELRVAAGSHIEYPRPLTYRLSATDMAVMAMAWLILAALLESWFFLGGAIGSASVALAPLPTIATPSSAGGTMNPQPRLLSAMAVLLVTGLACSLTGSPAAPTTTTPATVPTDTALPPVPTDTPAPTLPAGSGPCEATSAADVTIYTRPSLLADIFSTIALATPVEITSRSADGWLGFDPGVAQAANIGVFRQRWIPPDASVSLTGNCAGVPIESWVPAPGACYQMSMGPVEVHASADPTSAVSHTLMVGEFVAVTGRTPTGWLFVNGNDGNVPGVIGFIPELEMNASGPCDSIPTV